jgi:hypothetical protein
LSKNEPEAAETPSDNAGWKVNLENLRKIVATKNKTG